ncbi:MAG: sigma-70 family RNA polymerase sigma factor [Actinomycetota bacterium]
MGAMRRRVIDVDRRRLSDATAASSSRADEESREHVPRLARLLRVLHMGSPAPADAHQMPEAVAGTFPDPIRSLGAPGGSRRPSPSSFDQFYAANYATVVRLAFSLCGSRAIAEELAQEGFVAAHARWRRISRFDRPDLWVRRVVINRSISFRRRQASERTALARASRAPSTDASIDVADDEVLTALRRLSPRQAEVLALVYLEDRPIAEVAEILQLGTETVKTHLKRGREALAELITAARLEPAPEPEPER